MTEEAKTHLVTLKHLQSVAEKSQAFTAEVALAVAEVIEAMGDPTVVFYSETKPDNMTSNDLWVRIIND